MFRYIFTVMLLSAALGASAQKSLPDQHVDSLLKSNKIIFVDGRPAPEDMGSEVDSFRQKISAFYYDQFRQSQDPGIPYFFFMSKDANLSMGIGGAVRMRGYYDWGGAIPASGMAPYLIPMTPDPTNMRHLGTTPAGTALYFRVIGRNKALGNYQLYIETNFNGYQSRDLHLKKAYAIINDFTVGYASSTFSDPAALPPTVDAQGPCNKISPTSVLVRYMPVLKDKWYLAVSAETPSASIGDDGVATKALASWLPDFAAFAQYQWTPGQHVRLAGIVRSLGYRDLVAGQDHNLFGWGMQLSSVVRPLSQLTAYLTFNYGRGIGSLGGDLLIGRYDLIADPARTGTLYAPASLGWCAGLQYNFRHDLFMSVTASQCRLLPLHAVSPDEYKYGVFSAVNVFWNMSPRIQVAAEYDFAARHNFNGGHRNARRVGLMCQFSF